MGYLGWPRRLPRQKDNDIHAGFHRKWKPTNSLGMTRRATPSCLQWIVVCLWVERSHCKRIACFTRQKQTICGTSFVDHRVSRVKASKSFHESVTPGKHQCMQSSCFFPPATEGWPSALNSLMWVISSMWKFDPLSALNRCWFTSRASAFVPLFFKEKSCSTWWNKQLSKIRTNSKWLAKWWQYKKKSMLFHWAKRCPRWTRDITICSSKSVQ